MTPLEYIQVKGIEYQLQAGQIVLKSCPFCGDRKGHFYMDPDGGAFFCHKCDERGNLVTLRQHFGDFRDGHRMNKPHQTGQDAVREAFPDKNERSTMPDEKKAVEAH